MQKQIYHRSGPLYCGVTLIGVVFLVLFRLLPGSQFGVYALGEDRNYHERNGIHTKCSFFDTVNVTGYPSFPNGSYSYEGVLIPSHYVGTFDYIYKDLVDRVDVAPHIRGCICKLKPCINICCPWGYVPNNGVCEKDTKTELWPKQMINVTLNNGSIQNVNMYEQFVVQSFRPCTEMFSLIPEMNDFDAYQIFENGTMMREDDLQYIYKNEFCLVPTFVNDTDLHYTINPANCAMAFEQTVLEVITGYGKS